MRQTRTGAAIAAGLLAVAALMVLPAWAVGPDLPIQIHVDVVEALIVLRVDRTQIADLSAERQVYRRGELVEKFSLEPEFSESEEYSKQRGYGKWAEARYRLVSLAKELVQFEPGPYAVKLVVTGAWRVQPGAQLREERWLRFMVDKDQVRPLTLRQYSDLVDMPEIATNEEGRKTLVFVGGGPTEEVDAKETKHDFDKPFGLFGGLEAERVEKPRERQVDTSEKDEN